MPRKRIATAPEDFTPHMIEAWNIIIEDLTASDHYERTDRVLIESAAVMWGRARDVRGLINSGGYLTPSVRGTTSNPLLSVERESFKELRLICDLLPLTRSARQRLGLATGPQKKSLRDAAEEIGSHRLRAVE